jgi:hypothetical protein
MSDDRDPGDEHCDRLAQVKELECALARRNGEICRVKNERDRLREDVLRLTIERDRFRAALAAIVCNKNYEPAAGEFADDVLRNMTADEYARQLRIELHRGEG